MQFQSLILSLLLSSAVMAMDMNMNMDMGSSTSSKEECSCMEMMKLTEVVELAANATALVALASPCPTQI